jgi:lysophospholipase L1-like esterase
MIEQLSSAGRRVIPVVVVLAGLLASVVHADISENVKIPIRPAGDDPMQIIVGPGTVTLANGKTVQIVETRLTLDRPELRSRTIRFKAPKDYSPEIDRGEQWNIAGEPGVATVISLSPPNDEQGSKILGGLFRAILPESVVVRSADGARTFKLNEDYRINPRWPQLVGVDGRLGEHGQAELTATYQWATQRIDLVQVLADGTVQIKRGISTWVCPPLPAPDDGGAVALASVYVAPWTATEGKGIAQEDILPIHQVQPVAPINPGALSIAKEKLAAGQEVKIAFMGDSVTLGAEAGKWWADVWTEKNKSYASRVVVALRKLYPNATVTPIAAFKGGITTKAAPPFFTETVVPSKPDVVLIAFGLNDSHGTPPKNPPADFKVDITRLVVGAKESGAEVILVTPMETNPFMKKDQVVPYVQALREIAQEQNVACADVYAAWMQQAKLGVPPYSQLHNWINHPGVEGHALYAETVMRLFEAPAETARVDDGDAQLAAETASPKTPATQPKDESKLWEFRKPSLPPIDEIVARAESNPRIYGLYTWKGEYKTHRESIRRIGFGAIRHSGPFDDETMKMYAEDGLEIMVTRSGEVGELKGGVSDEQDEQFAQAYVRSVVEFVKRYGPDGAFFKENPQVANRPIEFVEIWNEPNFQYMIKPDGRPNKEIEAAREKLYAKLLPMAYQALKKVAPQIKVVGFGAGGAGAGDLRFIQHVHENNPEVAKSYDILSTHPYVNPAPTEGYTIQSWGSYSIASSLQTIRQTLGRFHDQPVRIWYTEIGWPVSKADGGRFDMDSRRVVLPTMQAAYLCRLYAYAQRLGVERVHVMFATDTDRFNGGFFLQDGTWRPSAHAVATMIKQMPAPKLLGAISDGEDGYFAYRFATGKPDGSEVIMAWNVAGPKTVTLPVQSDQVAVTHMMGEQQTVQAKENQITIEIGPLPVYVGQ